MKVVHVLCKGTVDLPRSVQVSRGRSAPESAWLPKPRADAWNRTPTLAADRGAKPRAMRPPRSGSAARVRPRHGRLKYRFPRSLLLRRGGKCGRWVKQGAWMRGYTDRSQCCYSSLRKCTHRSTISKPNASCARCDPSLSISASDAISRQPRPLAQSSAERINSPPTLRLRNCSWTNQPSTNPTGLAGSQPSA